MSEKIRERFNLENPETLYLPDEIEDQIIHNPDRTCFQAILTWGYYINVSDISIQTGAPIKIKVSNLVFQISKTVITEETMSSFISFSRYAQPGDNTPYLEIMNGGQKYTSYVFKIKSRKEGAPRTPIRYRVITHRTAENGMCMSMRLNSSVIPQLEAIGQTRNGVLYSHMFPMKGINLITGAVDSGKTTLIYSCLQEYIVNDPRHAFIDTYENPIEGDLEGLVKTHKITNKVVRQCPSPEGVSTFVEGIEFSLRKNTDIILAGEVRSSSEIQALIYGALSTGKLILATLHTDSIPVTITRLLNGIQSDDPGKTKSLVYDLIMNMNMIVSQKLLTTVTKKRVAVNEVFLFNREIKSKLATLPMHEISNEIKKMLIESKETMVDKAKILLEDGVISKEVYDEFEYSFAY